MTLGSISLHLGAEGGNRTHTPLTGPRILSRQKRFRDRNERVPASLFWRVSGDPLPHQWRHAPARGASSLPVTCQYRFTRQARRVVFANACLVRGRPPSLPFAREALALWTLRPVPRSAPGPT